MKKKYLGLLSLACVVGTLAACGNPAGGNRELALGVGMISAAPALSYGAPQLELNFATALYEGDKVVATLVDVYQIPLSKDAAAVDTTKDYATETNVLTKRDRHDGYGMLGTSQANGIGKEWYDQADALETYAATHTTWNEADADLTAGCSMVTTDLFAAITEAKTNINEKVSVASGTYTIALGHKISFEANESVLTQVNISVIGLLLDSSSKVVTSYLDEIQIPLTFTAGAENPYSITPTNAYGSPTTQYNYKGQVIASKKELGYDYDMLETSQANGIGKEWFEQAEAFEDYLVGKKVEEINLKDSTLLAGCSMYAGSYEAACDNAVDSTLYNTKSVTL